MLPRRELVAFEPGTVTAENFTAFAGFLGEFFHYAGPHTPRAPENPDATVVALIKMPEIVWHTDGGFRADAPAFTALFGKSVPKNGGDTMFANAAYVYEQLDPLFAKYLESLKVIQSPDATGHITDRYLDPRRLLKPGGECRHLNASDASSPGLAASGLP